MYFFVGGFSGVMLWFVEDVLGVGGENVCCLCDDVYG